MKDTDVPNHSDKLLIAKVFSLIFSLQYPKLVTPSYVVAFGYCFADAVSAGYQVMSEDERVTVREYRAKETRAAIATFDTLLWQSEFLLYCALYFPNVCI